MWDELGDRFDMNILPFVKHRQWEPVVYSPVSSAQCSVMT